MEEHEITVGRPYAYVGPLQSIRHPLKARVAGEPRSGLVWVTVFQSDGRQEPRRVSISHLLGCWDSMPLVAAWRQGDLTWAQIADRGHRDVRQQRDLADRLTSLGIRRTSPGYADRGHEDEGDALHLTIDELQRLLTLAELGKDHWDEDHEPG